MVNPNTGEEVPSENIRKGVEIAPGQFVLVNQKELEELEPAESRDVVIERFIDPGGINHQWYDRPYFLGPDEDAPGYWALVKALEDEKKVGLARWVMRKREYVGVLRPSTGYLMLITLRFAEEVVSAEEVDLSAGRKPDAREIKMAQQLVEALAGEFEPEAFRDEYRQRLMEFIQQKAHGHKLRLHKPVERKPAKEKLTEVLEASLNAVRSKKAG
jgi:DNA end-binding protein Ku